MSRTLLLGLFAAFISLAVGEADAGYEAAAEPATVHISTTACGEEAAEEVIPLLKTIAIHANPKNKYFVHVFMNNHTEFPLIKGHPRRRDFEAAHVDISFHAIRQQGHVGLFKPCSTNRLFVPELLPDVDATIYMDADTLAMTDLATLWRHFSYFNETQELAATREGFQCGNASTRKWWYEICGGQKTWYPAGSWDDIVAPTGINAGILLMNLTRLRATGAVPAWEHILSNRTELYLGDQDVLNIHYNHSIERLYLLPCRWNLRPDTMVLCPCVSASVCPWVGEQRVRDVPAEEYPWEVAAVNTTRWEWAPGIVHGNRGVFGPNGQYHGMLERVMEFDMSDRGNETAVKRTIRWP